MSDPVSARRKKVWADKAPWSKLIDDAYDYAVPLRRPAERVGAGASRTIRLHDATACNLVFASASNLRDDIAPPGQPLARVRPSRLARQKLMARDPSGREFEAVQALVQEGNEVVNAAFLGGGFNAASLECCIDAHVSTGAILAVEGNLREPVRFASIPMDQIACEVDAFGEETLISWKQRLTKRQIREAFPRARFPSEWLRDFDATADKEEELEQCFVRRPSRIAWDMYVYLNPAGGGAESPVQRQVFKTCPIILMRYQRVPGEAYGRGPILMLLPTIKVLNAAQELQLKAASIQMLGLWMYRTGGSFNPETAKLAPGAFWPVTNTGGMFGADIQRLDTASGRLDIGTGLMNELRNQIGQGLQRSAMPTEGATPRSATEFMVRDKENLRSYRGAYGRMVEDFVPKLYWRVAEICFNLGLLPRQIPFDALMMQLDVLSPLAAAMRAQKFEPGLNYLQYLMQTGQDPDEYMDRAQFNEDMAYETGVLSEYAKSKEQRAAYLQEKQAGQMAAMMAQKAMEAPIPETPAPGVAA